MSKRWLFFPLAVALLVNLAFVTPSQAGSTVITVNSLLDSIPTGVTSITGVDVTFSGVPSFSDLTVVVPKGASATVSGNEVDITIPSNASSAYLLMDQAFATFTFAVPGDGMNVRATSTTWLTMSGGTSGTAVGTSSVLLDPSTPEPASMALLGIGMAGLFAFRRYFRRNSNVQA